MASNMLDTFTSHDAGAAEAAAAAADAANPAQRQRTDWVAHMLGLRPELRMPRSSVIVQHGESDNSFEGAGALVQEIRRKHDAVHFVLKHNEHEVVVRFSIETVEGVWRMPILRFACYSADASITEHAVLRAILTCIDETKGMRMDECVVATIAHWPAALDEFELKTMMTLYNYDKACGDDDDNMQLTLHIRVLDQSSLGRSAQAYEGVEQQREEFLAEAADLPIEQRCVGVVERRFDEVAEFSPLTRNPYNRRDRIPIARA